MKKLKFLVKAIVLIVLSLSIKFTFAQPPPSSTPIIGDSVLCVGEEYSFSTYAYVGVETFEWVVPLGAVVLDGDSSVSIRVYVDSIFVGGYLSVRGWDSVNHYGEYSEKYLCLSDLLASPNSTVSQLSKAQIEVYPNPTSGHLHLVNVSEGVEIRVMDVSGKSVFVENYMNDVDISCLPPGIYILCVMNENSSDVVKVQKQ